MTTQVGNENLPVDNPSGSSGSVWSFPCGEGRPAGFDVHGIEQICGRIGAQVKTAPEGASTPAEGLTATPTDGTRR